MTDASLRIDPRQADAFAAAMRRERGASPAAPAPVKPPLRGVAALRPDDVDLGEADLGGAVGVSLGALLDGRLLIQGASGAGKSWTLRRLIERTHSRVAQILVDPEGEFAELADALGFVALDGAALDIAAVETAALRLREHSLCARLDLSQLERERQMQIFAAFARALVAAPREHWTPALVLVDEAHLFAPYGGALDGAASTRKEAIQALVDLMSRGRKRGLGGVLATQRLARMAKSVVSEALNFMVGNNSLDLDIARAAETIGWDRRRAFDRLPMLAPGEFVAVGPAFSRSPAALKVGATETRHCGARTALLPPPRRGAGEASALVGLDALVARAKADSEARGDCERLPAGARAVREFIRDPSAPLAMRIFAALAPLAPEGAAIAELPAALGVERRRIDFALALLDSLGTIEFSGEGAALAARIAGGMRT
jgi:hypothetical protein